jgi:hypothetical protein
VSISVPSEKSLFYAKSWHLYVAALAVTMIAIFCAILGPLFLFEVFKKADGKPAPEAGIAMSIIAIPMSLIALLGWFNVIARFKPLLRLCQEGIELNVVGATKLDGIPLIPGLVRVAWAVLSLQGFKSQLGWIPWEDFQDVEVTGLPMMRLMTIQAKIAYRSKRGNGKSAKEGTSITFRQVEFKEPLENISARIRACHEDPRVRNQLPSST